MTLASMPDHFQNYVYVFIHVPYSANFTINQVIFGQSGFGFVTKIKP